MRRSTLIINCARRGIESRGGVRNGSLCPSHTHRLTTQRPTPPRLPPALRRSFHSSMSWQVLKPFLLADIGEGIRECEVIQWFVEPGARVEQFDKLCEVQSDKASVEITSRFDGVIKRLHYEAGDMAIVGKPLVDIDIQSEIAPEDEGITTPPQAATPPESADEVAADVREENARSSSPAPPPPPGSDKHASLATPAVRHLTKELRVEITQVRGTGREGRVMKEDVYKFAQERDQGRAPQASSGPTTTSEPTPQTEMAASLTPIQAQMFKSMTRSLSIPHFLYSDDVALDALESLRRRLVQPPPAVSPSSSSPPHPKLTYLPFIIKAVSLALHEYPLLNSRLDTTTASNGSKPRLISRSQHNIGIAMATPSGLLVPNIKDVSRLSIGEIASALSHLQTLASGGKLSTADLSGGTITISNIGSIGGTVVSPILVDSELAILGVGRARVVPAFRDPFSSTAPPRKGTSGGSWAGGEGRRDTETETETEMGMGMEIIKRRIATFSWAADHRVVDGATLAFMAERVRGLVQDPDLMLGLLR
ncbi:MAG: hypothetical protein M1838_004646 [Thelocarpon superellum]|nr:MAG: hypothetical protein M1838_004646 [Thelocarpon superellum]